MKSNGRFIHLSDNNGVPYHPRYSHNLYKDKAIGRKVDRMQNLAVEAINFLAPEYGMLAETVKGIRDSVVSENPIYDPHYKSEFKLFQAVEFGIDKVNQFRANRFNQMMMDAALKNEPYLKTNSTIPISDVDLRSYKTTKVTQDEYGDLSYEFETPKQFDNLHKGKKDREEVERPYSDLEKNFNSKSKNTINEIHKMDKDMVSGFNKKAKHFNDRVQRYNKDINKIYGKRAAKYMEIPQYRIPKKHKQYETKGGAVLTDINSNHSFESMDDLLFNSPLRFNHQKLVEAKNNEILSPVPSDNTDKAFNGTMPQEPINISHIGSNDTNNPFYDRVLNSAYQINRKQQATNNLRPSSINIISSNTSSNNQHMQNTLNNATNIAQRTPTEMNQPNRKKPPRLPKTSKQYNMSSPDTSHKSMREFSNDNVIVDPRIKQQMHSENPLGGAYDPIKNFASEIKYRGKDKRVYKDHRMDMEADTVYEDPINTTDMNKTYRDHRRKFNRITKLDDRALQDRSILNKLNKNKNS